jgi:hypothetical protein
VLHKIWECFYYLLHIVIKQDSCKLIKLLLDDKQKLDMEIKKPYTKRTALHMAAGKCSREVLEKNSLLFNINLRSFVDNSSFIRRRIM